MARPIKQGLDYFSFDVDFYDNRKIRKIMRSCGPAAGSVLTCLLCNIYHGKGYYILWDEDLPFDIADKVGVSEGAVTEIVQKALQVDFFHARLYEKHKILTSSEIQKRYKMSTAKRQEVVIDAEYLINGVSNSVSGGRNLVNTTSSTQSKVKESKGEQEAPAVFGGSNQSDHDRSLQTFDAEQTIRASPIQLERIMMSRKLSKDAALEALHKYHLFLEEKEQYPKSKKSVFAGYEKWLMNEKNFSGNGPEKKQAQTTLTLDELKEQRHHRVNNPENG